MGYHIRIVPTAVVFDAWPKARDHLMRAVEVADGRMTEVELYDRLAKNAQTLWLVLNDDGDCVAAATTRVEQYPEHRYLRVETIGGSEFDNWYHDLHDAFIVWAKAQNCEGMELTGRSGWVRKLKSLGWEQSFIICTLKFPENITNDEQGQ